MPSFCIIESCKRVKQVGDTISFHKFPMFNKTIFDKWKKFVELTSKGTKEKNITKYSSICSQHFQDSDFVSNCARSRKFLRKTAIPTIDHKEEIISEHHDEEPMEIIPIPDEDESCGLCRALSNILHPVDDYVFAIMRKCLPFINFNLSVLQKICEDCMGILSTFSIFIDKVLVAQSFNSFSPRIDIDVHQNIKLEPIEDFKAPMMNFDTQTPKSSLKLNPAQKKCEILEIVDIKPFNSHFLPFTSNALTCDTNEVLQDNYEEDEIQILSPKQLKVEITDHDEENGENEFELIKNYILISSIFLHDHNYVKENECSSLQDDVKTELDENVQCADVMSTSSIAQDYVQICCKKKFKSVRAYLVHKIKKHKRTFQCSKCKKKFFSFKYFTHHRVCCKRYQSSGRSVKQLLLKFKEKKNVQKNNQTPAMRHTCKICNKSFKGSKNLYQHKFTHKESGIHCSICGKVFKRKHGLRQHIKAQHEKQKLFQCSTCHHSYALKGDVKRCRHSDLKRRA